MKNSHRIKRGEQDFRIYFHFLLESELDISYNPDKQEIHDGYSGVEIHTIHDLELRITNILRVTMANDALNKLDENLVKQAADSAVDQWFAEFYPEAYNERQWYLHFIPSENFYKQVYKIKPSYIHRYSMVIIL